MYSKGLCYAHGEMTKSSWAAGKGRQTACASFFFFFFLWTLSCCLILSVSEQDIEMWSYPLFVLSLFLWTGHILMSVCDWMSSLEFFLLLQVDTVSVSASWYSH